MPELHWQTPHLGGGSKSQCPGLIAQRGGLNTTRKGYPAGLSMTAQEELWCSTALTLQEASVKSFWHSHRDPKYLYAWLLGHKVLCDDKVLYDCRFLRSMKNQILIPQRSHIKQHRTRILSELTLIQENRKCMLSVQVSNKIWMGKLFKYLLDIFDVI